MITLLTLCLLLVMGCLLMTLSALTQLEKLKLENKTMSREMALVREEYQKLTQGWKTPSTTPQKTTAKKSITPEDVLQSNAYEFQALIERFSFSHKGHYPMSLDDLAHFTESEKNPLYLLNPYTETEHRVTRPEFCMDITLDPVDEGVIENKGKLLYQANPDENNQISDYTIAAFDSQGILLRDKNNEVFTLSKAAD